MVYDVVSASYKGAYRLEITFKNGESGVVDFSPYLQREGIFSRFRDINFFRAFSVDPELGTLTWPNEVDIAPETLYARATGAPLPAWMVVEETPEQTASAPKAISHEHA